VCKIAGTNKIQAMQNDFLTIKEVSEKLQITRQTLRNWTKQGLFPSPIKIGRRVYYLQSDINKLKKKLK